MLKRRRILTLSFSLAIIMAFSIKYVPYTGTNSNNAKLQSAIKMADKTVNTTSIGDLGGQYPESACISLKASIDGAKKVLKANSSSHEIESATESLNNELNNYLKSRISGPWDKYKISDKITVKKREVRAAWISSVNNIDWPSTKSWKIQDKNARIETQKKDLITMLDKLKDQGVNTVFFQVRPTSDAFYKSKLAPWSYWLTGKYGEDPGFDPLEFAIEEAHKRCLELHAWCNPYRVSMPAELYTDETGEPLKNLDQVKAMLSKDKNNIYSKHPDWIKIGANRLVLDPGIPGAQKYVEDCIMEIVNNYDVDGIHFDDYFYPVKEGFDDGYGDIHTFYTYGDTTKFTDIKDWRRNNTYTLIKTIHDDINNVKPWVKFGVSPAGVWRNKSDDETGSDTNAGIPNYDTAYADTKKWVLDEIIDYICPQVYWTFANKYAPYGTVASWWSDLLKNNPKVNTQLYIGLALYCLNPGDEKVTDPYWNTVGVGDQEIARQLKFNAANKNIDGSSIFTYNSFLAKYPNAESAALIIKNNLWTNKTLVTSMPWKNVSKPVKVTISSASYNLKGVTLNWTCNDDNTRYFVIYRFNTLEKVDINNPKNIIDKVYKNSNGLQSYTDFKGNKNSKYVITALNRISDEGEMSNIASVKDSK